MGLTSYPPIKIAADYVQALLWSIPRGLAWEPPTGSRTRAFWEGLAEEYARLESRLAELWLEGDPRTCDETLADWERVLGLPEDGTILPVTDDERRATCYAKLISQGGCNGVYFASVAAALGYSAVVVEDAHPFRVGINSCGDPLAGESWGFAWTLTVTGGAGPDPILEARINRIKPSHTICLFEYTP